MKYILVQDRDKFIKCNTRLLNLEIKYLNDKFFAANVRHDETLLGTYDGLADATYQINAILKCRQPIYVMGGFENYEMD